MALAFGLRHPVFVRQRRAAFARLGPPSNFSPGVRWFVMMKGISR